MKPTSSQQVKSQLFDTNRLGALSDGVFAIVITLLILELRVPEIASFENTGRELAHKLLDLIPKLVSFVVSFFYISIYWFNHHQLFSDLKRADRVLFWLNTVFLLFLTFIPFPTALIGSYPGEALAVIFYGVAMLLTAVSFVAMKCYIAYVLIPGSFAREDKSFLFFVLAGPLMYVAAILLAFFSIKGAIALYILIPFIYLFAEVRIKIGQ